MRKALELLPEVGFVNAYGLTETSSTIAVLTPEDHRAAHAAEHEPTRRRLGSVGQPVPGIEVQIRAEDGTVLGPEEVGELFVRGDQVSGRYAEIGSVLDDEGWFPTKDVAYLDADGYLFIGGRSDDTIIRGGENIALPRSRTSSSNIRTCVTSPSSVSRTPSGARSWWPSWCRSPTSPRTRRTCAPMCASTSGFTHPDRVVFRHELPTTPTGKVLRRQLADELKSPTT